MFVDRVKLTLIAGKGGDGTIAWRKEKYTAKGGPFGGNGGRGGSILIQSDKELTSLEGYQNRRLIRAKNGSSGGICNRQGKRGEDLILRVPAGTFVRNCHTNTLIYDFTDHNEIIPLCRGGKGGKGNTFFKTPTNQAPNKRTLGCSGEEMEIEMELKLIADVGLIGLPNAGKSTLLSHIAATPFKTGAYPFTTLTPNVSYIEFEDYSRLTIADIPGIIPNAHQNKGLGLAFLRHVERTSILIYLIDISGEEGRDPFRDFLTLQNELRIYAPLISQKPFFVALNKIDRDTTYSTSFKERYPYPLSTLFEVSALTGKGISKLFEQVKKRTTKVVEKDTHSTKSPYKKDLKGRNILFHSI